MCCCVRIDPCCLGKRVVIMPFEMFPFPWCCCSNRVSACDNCFNLCGAPTGNPKFFGWFAPQPKNTTAFVKMVQAAMNNAKRSGAPVVSTDMER